MTARSPVHHPKLRPLDIRPFSQNGQSYLLLRDPLELSDRTVAVPQLLGPALMMCDGTRDARGIVNAVALRFGVQLGPHVVRALLEALDEALLLDNENFARAHGEALRAYREAAFRPPALAGRSYPEDAHTLRNLLQSYLDAADIAPDGVGRRGLISPHIDYTRGGPVYARVWKRAQASVQEADLVVLLGTDHAGSAGTITLTRQHYATPFGVLPTALDIVDRLAQAIGRQAAFAEELHHRGEHSIELAAVWLHYLRDEKPCELVPILCGSFSHLLHEAAAPRDDRTVEALVGTLQRETRGRRALVVAAGDLAHVGPAFGGAPLDEAARRRLHAADEELMGHICAGSADDFFNAIKSAEDRNNVCGAAPIYLTLHMLGATRGETVAYEHCPADERDTSTVSVCGVVLH